MTLDSFVTKYNNQVVGDGECGTLVRAYMIEVQNYTPPSYPSAKDYWFNDVPGYSHQSSPLPGDIPVYNAHGVYTDGHMAIQYDSRVFEQNADPDGSPAHLFNRANTYLLGYLRKDGGTVMEPADYRANEGDVVNVYQGMLGRKPSAEEIKIYVGQDFKTILYAFMGSDEFKARVSGGGSATKLNPGLYQVS